MINNNLLQYLYCPKCKSDLKEENNFLICKECGERYKIKGGIPILINLNNLPRHLQGQIRYFEKENKAQSEYRLEEWQKSYIRRLDENFQLFQNKILIDVGTGSGYIAVEMAKRGLKIIACDLTLKGLTKLKVIIKKEHLENNLFLVCCSAESLPFKNKTADYLVSNAVLEHLPKEKEAISEINRVCKNKSGIMITVPLRFRYILPFFWLPTYIHDKKIGHLRRYDKEDLKDKFYNWKLVRIYYTGHFKKVLHAIFKIVKISLSDDCNIESSDDKKSNKKYGASNICAIFKREMR